MPISQDQYREMLLRTEGSKLRQPAPDDATDDEIGLHGEIIKWIKQQYPQPAYIHARTDKKSGINLGAPDFTIFYKGKVFLIECKTRLGKRKPTQLAWGICAELNGFPVHEVRSFSQFLEVINS